MTEQVRIDLQRVRQFATRLTEAAGDLHTRRPDLLSRLANGDGIHPVVKTKDNIKVTIGADQHQHTGTRAGELIADRIKGCGDAFTTVEEGLRALGSVMGRMADALESDDTVTRDELNTALEGLYCVVLVSGDSTSQPCDWFGLGQA